MKFATYSRPRAGEVPGSLALAFDDASLDGWTAMRPMFMHYGARVTFFISEYPFPTDAEKAELRQLAADGHDIEYHSTRHLNAENYANEHGADAYITDDILPSLAGDAGRWLWHRRSSRTRSARARAATDEALEPLFTHIRAI